MPPGSYSTIAPTNLDLGPMRVTLGGVDLGATLGNASVSVKYNLADLKADQLGSTVLDRRAMGLEIKVTTELAEVLNKDRWKTAFPAAQLVSSGSKLVRFVPNIGASQRAAALPLILHPLNKPDADLTADIKFFLAAANGESELVYGPGDQVKLKAVWDVYPDLSSNEAPFAIYGDPAVGLVAATAGAPVFTGTGNGTLGSVSVFSGFTKTETITVKVVGVPGANLANWSVTGSLSGALGIATNGVAFVSPQIAFTITDGATDFVLNDQFTIATTAANYA